MFNNGNTSKNVRGTAVIDGSLENTDFADDALSGDKIDGGTISNFASTGIDDNSSSEMVEISSANSFIFGGSSVWGQDPSFQLLRNGGAALAVKRGTSYGEVAYFVNKDGSLVGHIDVAAGSTSYVTTSDYRLKENVVQMTGSIARLKQLKPSRFSFIVDPDNTVDGFLAHEAQAVVPEAVSGEKDGTEMQGIDQSKLVPLLVGALQEAIARIEALENAP